MRDFPVFKGVARVVLPTCFTVTLMGLPLALVVCAVASWVVLMRFGR